MTTPQKYWEIFDDQKQRPYYFEIATKKSSWKKPVGENVQIIPTTLEEIKRQKMQKKRNPLTKNRRVIQSVRKGPKQTAKK